MPSVRFLNLPQEKRCKIIEAVRTELAQNPVDELSINRIIHNADISRGSFYQYFDGKEDLLEYVFLDLRHIMIEIINKSIQSNNGDMFDAGAEVLDKLIEVGSKSENKKIFVNVFSYMKVTEDMLIDAIANEENFAESFINSIDRSKLKLTSDSNVKDLIRLVIALFRDSMCRCFADMESADEIINDFKKRMEIIKYGAWI